MIARSLFVVVVAVAPIAHADPVVQASIDADHVQPALASLVRRIEEPIGMVARIADPELGLEKDDIVRTIQGESAIGYSYYRSAVSVLYLEVQRRTKTVV